LAFVLGIGTTVMGTLAGYAAYHAEPVEAKRVVDGAVIVTDGLNTETKQFNSLLRSNDVAEVADTLLELNNWPRKARLPVKISANRKREQLANKLLSMDGISETDRELAIDSMIESLTAIYGLDLFHDLKDRQIGEELSGVAGQYVDDPSPSIRRSARLAMLKYHAFEYLKYRRPELHQPMEDSLLKMLSDYPNDPFVQSNVKLVFKRIAQIDPNTYKRLSQALLAKRSEFEGTGVMPMLVGLGDRMVLLETRYTEQFENRWVNGAEGQRQLLETSLQLAREPSVGIDVIEEIDRVGQWFESVNKLDQARQIFQALASSPQRFGGDEATRLSKTLGEQGLTRCGSLGKPAEFTGYDVRGRALTAERFRGRVVVVVFWSVRDSESKQEMRLLHSEKGFYGSLPVDVIAVCVDRDPTKSFGATIETLNRFICTDPAKYGESGIPFTKQCPISRVPQIMLINQQGQLVDANVPPACSHRELGL
jgi:hypothetical protein